MAHTFSNLLSHIIFSTKDRAAALSPDIASRMWGYLGGVLKEERCIPLAVGGMPDHVHMLVKVPAVIAVSDVMRVVKTNSSRWAHETWPNLPFAWQVGYGAFSVSQSSIDDVRTYIARQEEHHRRMTFQEEFVAFLTRNEVAYDERYTWE